MTFLRDRWRRSPLYQFYALMEPIDRVTAWVAMALALALGFSAAALMRGGA